MRVADDDRFREFARGHAGILRRGAYLLCGDWHLAQDLTQETLVKLHGAWQRVGAEHSPVNYALRVLVRCWLDERRRPWRRRERHGGAADELPDLADPAAVDPATAHQRATERSALLDALAAIPPRQRGTLVLRYFTALSVAETAQVLGCSEGTVKSQTARGLSALRTVLAEPAREELR
jgi:RNA polymerase sigma-70 factor (sigma-E family)